MFLNCLKLVRNNGLCEFNRFKAHIWSISFVLGERRVLKIQNMKMKILNMKGKQENKLDHNDFRLSAVGLWMEIVG